MQADIRQHSRSNAERQLWCAVLHTAIVDLCQPWEWVSHDRSAGRRMRPVSSGIVAWIGAWPSRDFREVCNLAGLDPEAAHKRLLAMTEWPEERLTSHIRKIGSGMRREDEEC